jgi:hypothetical protein
MLSLAICQSLRLVLHKRIPARALAAKPHESKFSPARPYKSLTAYEQGKDKVERPR